MLLEHCVKQDGRIRFASSHESPLYPYTGPASFTGPLGTVLNVELPAGTGMDTYRDTFTQRMLPHVLKCDDDEALSEGLVIVSAGFDALDVDPLANLDFKPEDYEELCATIIKAVSSSPGYHHVICGLEGGYNLEGNGISAAAVHTVLGLARL
jgi:acetoin utilization deacetylase AcuC-like enzyme